MSNLTDALIAAKLIGGSGGSGGGSGLPEIRTETVEVLALQTLAFEDRQGVYGTTVAGTFDMAAGDTFTVTYDGDDYEVTVFEVEDRGILGFGNPSLAGLGADTGEPFCGGYNEGMELQIIASTSDPTHEVGISSTVYNPANGSILVVDGGEWKAVPSGGVPFVVNVTPSGESTATVDKSFAEIADAYKKGVVYFNLGGKSGVVTKVTQDGETSYQADIQAVADQSGWKLLVASIRVYIDDVDYIMNSFTLTLSNSGGA